MAWTWAASLILGVVAFVVLFVGLAFPAGSMTAAANDCMQPGHRPGYECGATDWRVTWRLSGEERHVRQMENGTAAATVEARGWEELRAAGAPGTSEMSTAQTLALTTLGVTLLGILLVLVGRFTHPAPRVAGALLLLAPLLLAGAAALLAWTGVTALGTDFKLHVAGPDVNWATLGPYFGPGLMLLGIGGLLGTAAGVLGTLPVRD